MEFKGSKINVHKTKVVISHLIKVMNVIIGDA